MGYPRFYDLEAYLFDEVGPRFREHESLSAFGFFCIVIWKANRAKSKIAKRLLNHGHPDLEEAVQALARGLSDQQCARDRLRYLLDKKGWGFLLPMATAILTILFPDDFTIYDARVCSTLGDFANLGNLSRFDEVWKGYELFKSAVERVAPSHLSLRDKDRYLWAKSFHEDLTQDIEKSFGVEPRATSD